MMIPAQPSIEMLSPFSRKTRRETIPNLQAASAPSGEFKQTFQEFVGGTFYQLMLKSMRSMHDKPAYFHGGQTEEIFRSRLDEEIATTLASQPGNRFSDELFQLAQLQMKTK